jgi:diaminopimelate epimerase
MKRRTRNYAAAADVDAQAPGRRARRRHRAARRRGRRHTDRVTFEKWQALGNDYLVVEQPVDADTVRRLCDRHTGVGADGVLVLARSEPAGASSRGCGSSTPTAARPSWSATRPRGAHVPARQGLGPRAGSSRSRRSPARSAPTVLDDARARRHGPREDLGEGEVRACASRPVSARQPAVRDPRRRRRRARGRSTCPRSAGDRARPAVPQPHERVVLDRGRADPIRARIFERGVGETMSSGTGATGRRDRHVLRGGDARSPSSSTAASSSSTSARTSTSTSPAGRSPSSAASSSRPRRTSLSGRYASGS